MADAWVASVESKIKDFADHHRLAIRATSREVSASFEIGCFHALTTFYAKKHFSISPENLSKKNEYRYLTSTNGNPANFSYIRLKLGSDEFEIRQQVRVRSHLHPNIAFCPDLIVMVG